MKNEYYWTDVYFKDKQLKLTYYLQLSYSNHDMKQKIKFLIKENLKIESKLWQS